LNGEKEGGGALFPFCSARKKRGPYLVRSPRRTGERKTTASTREKGEGKRGDQRTSVLFPSLLGEKRKGRGRAGAFSFFFSEPEPKGKKREEGGGKFSPPLEGKGKARRHSFTLIKSPLNASDP